MNLPRFLRVSAPSMVAILLGAGILWAATDGFLALTEEQARRLHVAQQRPAVPAFMLEDMNGGLLELGGSTNRANRIALVEFIYTTCPAICQAAGERYALLQARVKEAGLAHSVVLLSVSFDPQNDDARQMRRYAEQHGADGTIWTVARPKADDLEAVMQAFGVRVIPDGWGGFQHNAAIHVIDRSGRLSAILDSDDVEGAFRAVQERL